MREIIAATSAACAAGLLALGAGLATTLPDLAAASLALAAVWALLCRAAIAGDPRRRICMRFQCHADTPGLRRAITC